MIARTITTLTIALMAIFATAQNVGIGTADPSRTLEVEGVSDQFVRVRASGVLSRPGIEFVRNYVAFESTDWGILNSYGAMRILRSTDNFQSSDEILRLNADGNLGIGTNSPEAPLHIVGNEDASNSQDGYLMLGTKNSESIVIDNNEVIARDNGLASELRLQPYGGDIVLQHSGGNAYFGNGNSDVNIGGIYSYGKTTIDDPGFHMRLQNNDGTDNSWFIGASSNNWNVGDDQLLFSPTNNTDHSILRLRNIASSTTTKAPVEIHSYDGHQLLLDGNDIDSKLGPLYINYNTENNISFNAQGGNVGIGTNNATSRLHIKVPSSGYPAIWMRCSNTGAWEIDPLGITNNLGFSEEGDMMARVDEESGQYIALSDRNRKDNFEPLEDIMDKLLDLDVSTYHFKHDPGQRENIGMIAQEVIKVIPELVSEDDGHMKMSYSRFSVIAIKALQEQEAKIGELKQRLASIQKQKADTKSN